VRVADGIDIAEVLSVVEIDEREVLQREQLNGN